MSGSYYVDSSNRGNVNELLDQAELYRDQAQGYANAAEASSTDAETAEANAVASAAGAAGYATAANTSASNASSSASSASTSASNSASSAASSSGSAAAAVTAKTQAETAATAAANSASNATAVLSSSLLKANNLSDLTNVSTAKINLSLNNVNNTSDANKPISTAQAAGLVAKTSQTGAANMPSGSTAERPSTPTFGNQRANTTTGNIEWWNGSGWCGVIGNRAGFRSITTGSLLTAEDAGKVIGVTGTGPYSVQLPQASTVPIGSTIVLIVRTSGITVGRSGSDVLSFGTSNVTTVSASSGDTLTFISGFDAWYSEGGTVQLRYAPDFVGSLATSGYQKLPSGLIIQWGRTVVATAGDITTSLPIAFPGTFSKIIMTQEYTPGSGAIGYAAANPVSLSSFTWRGSTTGITYNYIALGY